MVMGGLLKITRVQQNELKDKAKIDCALMWTPGMEKRPAISPIRE